MSKETQTRSGTCPTHGSVEGTREVQKVTFPWIVTAIIRAIGQRRPFACPNCGARIQTS
ncbi:MAG TPA: hypothetical protein VKY26_04355 [Actinomycetota bacterium]|nr:hypothetical protein [Actinomycetota bacterium]